MTDFKSEYRLGQGLQVILSAHDKVMMRYGAQRKFEWTPSADNALLLADDGFIERFKRLHDFQSRSPEEREIILKSAQEMMAYAHFGTNTVMFKEDSAKGRFSLLEQSAAHEELHIWCQRDRIDPSPHSYHVNEQFIDYLALRVLGFMDAPLSAVPEELHYHIINAMLTHEILDALGKDADKLLFDVCQGKSQEDLQRALNAHYGQGPRYNKDIQIVHGADFYGRFKDMALITRTISTNPDFNNLPGVQEISNMMLEWILSKKRIRHLSREDLSF